MKERWMRVGVALLGFLVLLLVVGLTYAQVPGAQDEVPAQITPIPAGTAFTYQGQLKKDGGLVTDICSMAFRLYDQATGDTQVGDALTHTVPITGGLFTVSLDFGSGAFTGDARWLGVSVKCTGDSDHVDLGRQRLTPAPYALALPGLWTQQEAMCFNLIGGYSGNWVAEGARGATISGGGGDGYENRVTDDYGTVGGGRGNQAGDDAGTPYDKPFATVGGGQNNTAGGSRATVAGGWVNAASGDYATVGGGGQNTAGGECATVAGGEYITVAGRAAAVAGGSGITVTADYAAVGGGEHIVVTGTHIVVGGGYRNTAGGSYTTIGGGRYNTASDWQTTVGGGLINEASDFCATVSGGHVNKAIGPYATVGGGGYNTASGFAATIAGGGGSSLLVITNTASGDWSTIGGGGYNDVSGEHGTIGGGEWNTVSGEHATVSGGYSNTVEGGYAAVGGGRYNTASGWDAVVAGGYGNEAGSSMAAVGGGERNAASGLYATIPGGSNNAAEGFYSLAAGLRAKARHNGSFVWGDSTDADIRSSGSDQFIVRANGGIWLGAVTTDFTPTIASNVFISTSTGAYLSTAGVWTDVSDRDLKEAFAPVDDLEILARLAQLPVTTWSYKVRPGVRHIGPTAQDFYAAFGVGEDDRHIASLDAAGVCLAGIQGLHRLSQEQAARIEALEAENAMLDQRVRAAEQRMGELEARLTALESSGAAEPVPWGLLGGAGLLLAGFGAVWTARQRWMGVPGVPRPPQGGGR